ncbi:MAG: hypothetical protein QW756_07515, partial [Nitrososphaerota archaeon]
MTARGIAASTLVLTAYTVYSWSGVGLSVALAQIIESLQLPVESVGLIPTVWGIGLDAFSLAAGTL